MTWVMNFAFRSRTPAPHVAVERAFGHVSDDLDGAAEFPVEVPLGKDASLALGHVGGPPGCVQVMQDDRPVLHVGADTHLLGRADQNGCQL